MKIDVSTLTPLEMTTPDEWREWLAEHHTQPDGIWLRFYKKDTGLPSMTYLQALDEALCFGWIDGQSKSYDETSWVQKFTPRRPRSLWSKRNRDFVERLIQAGKMTPAGQAEIDRAKQDGRWDAAYDAPSTMTIPDDFLVALSKNKKAEAFFHRLNKSNQYAVAWNLHNAKKEETRLRRMQKYIEMFERGEKLH